MPEPVLLAESETFHPTPRQLLLWEYAKRIKPGGTGLIGYGGAAGGGKTRGLAEFAYDLCEFYPGTKILIARKDLTDLRNTTMEQFEIHLPKHFQVRKNSNFNWWKLRLPSWPEDVWSRVEFRGLKDWLGLGSTEYMAVLIDEAGEVPAAAPKMLLSRLRWKLPPEVRALGFKEKYFFVAGSNPWPGWFKQWFVDRSLPEEELEQLDAQVFFIPALAKDNPHLAANYEAKLRLLYPTDWVQRFLNGSWDVFEGQVYPQFSKDIHAWRKTTPDRKRLIPKLTKLIGGLDIGDPNAKDGAASAGVLAGKILDTNRLLILDCFEERGPDSVVGLVKWMAEAERLFSPYVDLTHLSTMGGARAQWTLDRSQIAAIELLRPRFSIKASRGGRRSVTWGIGLVANLLSVDASGMPGLYYLPHLDLLEDAFARYHWPDMEGKGADAPAPTSPVDKEADLMDALRYMCESFNRPAYDPTVSFRNQLPVYQPSPASLADQFWR